MTKINTAKNYFAYYFAILKNNFSKNPITGMVEMVTCNVHPLNQFVNTYFYLIIKIFYLIFLTNYLKYQLVIILDK